MVLNTLGVLLSRNMGPKPRQLGKISNTFPDLNHRELFDHTLSKITALRQTLNLNKCFPQAITPKRENIYDMSICSYLQQSSNSYLLYKDTRNGQNTDINRFYGQCFLFQFDVQCFQLLFLVNKI